MTTFASSLALCASYLGLVGGHGLGAQRAGRAFVATGVGPSVVIGAARNLRTETMRVRFGNARGRRGAAGKAPSTHLELLPHDGLGALLVVVGAEVDVALLRAEAQK